MNQGTAPWSGFSYRRTKTPKDAYNERHYENIQKVNPCMRIKKNMMKKLQNNKYIELYVARTI